MTEKSRIKNLSTRYLTVYKMMIWILLTSFFGLLIYRFFEVGFSVIGLPIVGVFFLYQIYRMNSKLYKVEFDDEFLYVIQKNQDMLIPLENIKDIELKSLGGHWEVTFYNPEQLGQKIYFKPSLLYPFNSKKKDAHVNVLWSNVEKAKRKKQDFQKNALRS